MASSRRPVPQLVVPAAADPANAGEPVPAPTTVEPARKIKEAGMVLTQTDLERINSKAGLVALLRERNIRLKGVLSLLQYEEELHALQGELVKLQRWVQAEGKRIAILFEGRDAAGKGGTIRRFIEHLNPRAMRVVALPKPTEEERGQWYFQRYMRQLPNAGEIVFFDRSWYNRAVVEPVNGFCTTAEYERFIQQVPEFEHMLYEDGVTIIKFWFSISKEEQLQRFDSRRHNPLKHWKLSPIDERAQELWDQYSYYKERLESIRYVLNYCDYTGKQDAPTHLAPDPTVVMRFHRKISKID
jgi:polyphosphate kinase